MSSSSSSPAAALQRVPGATAASVEHIPTPARRTLLYCLILIVAVLVAYHSITHNGFIQYDDDAYITDNSHVRAGLSRATAEWAFTTYEQANWHPLTWLSHALDCNLFGLNPAGPHYENVLLHAANAVILFLLLQAATGFRWRSLMVAALFALHPINVESVAWASERKNVLSMLFFLLAIYAYVWYARKPEIRRYAVVFSCFALALLSKPQAISLPFLLCLLDYWPLCRTASFACALPNPSQNLPRFRSGWRWLLLEKLPLFALSAASAVVTMKAQNAGNALQPFSHYSLLLRLETALVAYVRYLGKAFWPAKLVALYPHPTQLYPAWQVASAIVLLAVITALALRDRERRYLAVGWLWFLGSLVPMIGLIQVGFQAMADRYAYLPFIGLFVMMTWLVADWAKSWRISTRWLAVAGVACLSVLGILTYRQVGYWHDTGSFWQRTLALTPANYVAEDKLGEFLFSENRADEAAAHFRTALAIRPDGLVANLNLGAYEDQRGNLDAAIEHYQVVATHAGDVGLRATAYGSLGFVYRQMGQPLKARRSFETAVQLAPDRARAKVGLGLVAEDAGDFAEAIRQYSQAAMAQHSDVVYLLLAQALQRGGHADEGKAIYDRLEHSANFPQVQKTVESLRTRK